MVSRDMHKKSSIHEGDVRIIGGFLQYSQIYRPHLYTKQWKLYKALS